MEDGDSITAIIPPAPSDPTTMLEPASGGETPLSDPRIERLPSVNPAAEVCRPRHLLSLPRRHSDGGREGNAVYDYAWH
jgi:hypothetical protein